MVKVSIVVPIYNKEKYLDICIPTLLNQSLAEIEIILVNDGSKDQSLKICKYYEQIDNRIKVIDIPNGGVSNARNVGMEYASGEYIGFLDPDDWVEEDMYLNMYNIIHKYNKDIIMTNYYQDEPHRLKAKCFKINDEVLDFEGMVTNILGNLIGFDYGPPKYYYIMGSVWRCLFKRDFLLRQNLKFQKGITIMEDLIFLVEALLNTDGLCLDHSVNYHYVYNGSSVLHSYNRQMWNDQVVVYKRLESLLQNANLDDKMRNRLDNRYISMAFFAIQNEFKGTNRRVRNRFVVLKEITDNQDLRITIDRYRRYNINKPKQYLDYIENKIKESNNYNR